MLLPRKVGLWRGAPQEVPCGGSPPAICVDTGHWLTLGPMSTAVIFESSQPPWEVGIGTLSLELSSGGAGTCWGLSHRRSRRLRTPLQAPSSLLQKWIGECLPPKASVICSQVCVPFLQHGFCPKRGNLGPVLFPSAGHSPILHAPHSTCSFILFSFSPWHLSLPAFQYYIIDLILC